MKKILVIQQKMIGDVLTSTVICEALRDQHPEAIIHYLVYEHTLPVIAYNKVIDKIIPFTKKDQASFFNLLQFSRKLRKEKYDTVIDAYAKVESLIITALSEAQEKISFKKGWTDLFYTKTIQRHENAFTIAGNAIENRLQLVCTDAQIKKIPYRPRITISAQEKKDALKFLRDNEIDTAQPIFMISILGSSPDKSLPADTMAQVINTIVSKTKGTLLFNYMPSQKEEMGIIYKKLTPETQNQVREDVYAKGLRNFIALTSCCTALLGNEGGAVNMAKALNIPTYTIFSPWVRKDVWNMFEDGKKHLSIHLSDFEPELYTGPSARDKKGQAFDLYKKLTPERIYPSLIQFLKNI